MKRFHYIVCLLCLATMGGCGKTDGKQGDTPLTAYQEYQLAASKPDYKLE